MTETIMQPTPNARQQECIDNIDGKVLVLAGPGTGKTFTVIQRIKAMLERGISPEKILCLSFSNTAATEMQNKMAKIMGKLDTGVNVYTFHAFCNEIIDNYSDKFSLSDNYRVINDTVSRMFLMECLDEYKPKYFKNERNNSYGQIKAIKGGIEEIKRKRITKEEYFNNIKTNKNYQPRLKQLAQEIENFVIDKNDKKSASNFEKLQKSYQEQIDYIEKAKELWDLYELYKNKMEADDYVDYNDMIGLVLDKFESSPSFLDEIANRYEYILVDEYQDTNLPQNQIVFYLTHALKSENVFVVGDDDQIIYSFQGANLETIEGFLNEFPDTKVICLTENMRSTQNILDVAMHIADEDVKRLSNNPEYREKYNIDKKLEAKNKNLEDKKDIKVRLNKYLNAEQENLDIVNEIKQLVNSDSCPVDKDTGEKKLSEIAILVSGNGDAPIFAELLKDNGIPAEIKWGKSIFKIKASVVLYYYLQMLANPEVYADKLYKLLLLEPFNISPKDFLKLYEGKNRGNSFLDTMREFLEWDNPDNIHRFIKVYDELNSKIKSGETAKNIVLYAGAKTGIYDYYLNNEVNQIENIAGLKKLTEEARAFSDVYNKITLEEFVEYLEMVENDRELDIISDKPDTTMNAIQIITYHSSKGREFEYVYMPALQKRKWESSSKHFYPSIPVAEEERKDDDYWQQYKISDRVKTMYVGMTRAIHTLRLSYSVPSTRTQPSDWVIRAQDMMETNDYIDLEYDNSEDRITEFTKENYDYKRDFSEIIDLALSKKKDYSLSYVGQYLKCPKKFFYDEILEMPQISGSPDALSYGNAIHDTFEYLITDTMKNKEFPEKEDCLNFFKSRMKFHPFSSNDEREKREDCGLREVEMYYKLFKCNTISSLFGSEYEIRYKENDISYFGKVDFIVKNEDETYTIYDFKTSSKVPSKNSFVFDNENEYYYLQGCLYKYYFEKMTNKKVREVYFLYTLKPDKPILIDTSDKAMEIAINKFYECIEGMKNKDFEPCYKNDKTYPCEYCGYKEFCEWKVL